jgi:hypothetical protein
MGFEFMPEETLSLNIGLSSFACIAHPKHFLPPTPTPPIIKQPPYRK